MKNRFYYLALTLLFAVSAITSNAALVTPTIKEKVAGMTDAQKDERLKQIKQRVDEIKAMDKSALSRTERKNLRNELRNMNKEAKAIGHGGIYISLAGI